MTFSDPMSPNVARYLKHAVRHGVELVQETAADDPNMSDAECERLSHELVSILIEKGRKPKVRR